MNKKKNHEKRGWYPSAALLLTILFAAKTTIGGGADAPLYFTILHTNDEHSAVLPAPLVDYHPQKKGSTSGGLARLSRLANDIRAAKSTSGEPVVLVSAGDILGGAPHFWLIPGGEAPEISIMREIGYNVLTIGNHDFDYGPEILAHYYRTAGYPEAGATTPIVSSNLVIPQSHPLADCGIQDTHVLVLNNGLRLGFFGLLGKNAAKLATRKAPIDISDPISAAAEAVKTLKAMNVDVIIGLTHAGRYEDEALASTVPGIDIMITGHFHDMALEKPLFVGNTILVQSTAFLHHLGILELAYTRSDGKLRIRNANSRRPFLVPLDDSVEEDPVIAKSIARYTEKLNLLVKRLTENKVSDVHDAVLTSDFVLKAGPPLQESILGNFVADAMRLITEEKTGEKVDFAIQADGVIRSDVSPGSMPYSSGKICFYDLATAIGLGTGFDENPGYPLASIYLTGNDIYRMLELTLMLSRYADVFSIQMSGGRFFYDPDWVSLFRIPYTNVHVPTLRAVTGVERFTGNGVQTNSGELYTPISRNDDTLYHVVCDSYILSFFPKIAELLPFFKVIPKNRDGKEITLREAVIHNGKEELKFWQAVVAYALAQPAGEDGIPRMPSFYSTTGARIIQQHSYPVVVWLILALALTAGFFVVCLRFWKSRRKKKASAMTTEIR
ncbi:MAG TPA: bifunctional UDP-sugar hydrolase/5'-nucleotidase [Candidatus Hydrogenedentes bacterium]|mgnify:CR=1 FL=1|nr:bifunctional UDP-sugar hydrolase/5'-nucleotidase [Candidatus Hydrogenedentota bacterium]